MGAHHHAVAIGLSDGSVLEAFEIPHTHEGFGVRAGFEAQPWPLRRAARARTG